MKLLIEKLLELFNMIFTGFVISFIFKPEFAAFFHYFLWMILTVYFVAGIALICMEYLANKRQSSILEGGTDDGD